MAKKSNLNIDIPIETDELDIVFDDGTGYFECASTDGHNKHTRWCPHLAEMMSHNDDVDFWTKAWNASDGLGWTVEVPMIPTIAVFQPVQLKPVKVGKTEVYNAAELSVVLEHIGGRPQHIGTMNEGDALSSIRYMIQDWFAGTMMPGMEGAKRVCKSYSHKMASQKNWVMRMGTEAGRVGEYYCLWRTDKCMTCQEGNYTDWDADLIPEESKPKTPWR